MSCAPELASFRCHRMLCRSVFLLSYHSFISTPKNGKKKLWIAFVLLRCTQRIIFTEALRMWLPFLRKSLQRRCFNPVQWISCLVNKSHGLKEETRNCRWRRVQLNLNKKLFFLNVSKAFLDKRPALSRLLSSISRSQLGFKRILSQIDEWNFTKKHRKALTELLIDVLLACEWTAWTKCQLNGKSKLW